MNKKYLNTLLHLSLYLLFIYIILNIIYNKNERLIKNNEFNISYLETMNKLKKLGNSSSKEISESECEIKKLEEENINNKKVRSVLKIILLK